MGRFTSPGPGNAGPASWLTPSKNSSRPCKAKARRPAAPRFSAASRAAISGPGAKATAGTACTFCDTDFVGTDGQGGGKFADAAGLADAIAACWGEHPADRYVVFTGGEPLLQLDEALLQAVHAQGFTVAIETNGTLPPPPGIDWICVSPKGRAPVVVERGHELKLVFPQADARPEAFAHLAFEHFFLQPMDGPRGPHHPGRAVLPRPPAMAPEPANP